MRKGKAERKWGVEEGGEVRNWAKLDEDVSGCERMWGRGREEEGKVEGVKRGRGEEGKRGIVGREKMCTFEGCTRTEI